MDSRIKTAKGPTILLHSGAYFDLLDPWGSQFTIEDIAHGLSNTCRYAGQCNAFYSVAEHSWHTSYIVPEHLRFAALMHDAAEAFIGDVTRPLKSLLPDYKQIERGVEDAIAARFRIYGMDAPEVKHADLAMLAAEQSEIMPPHADGWAVLGGVIPAPVNLRMWRPEMAEEAFLDRYHQLVAGQDIIPESTKPSLQVRTTTRGFAVARSVDLYDQPWSIQDSSLATQEAIWLGGDGEDGGRAHLTRQDAEALIPLLRRFVDTGSIRAPEVAA
ncbi:hypothetical protein LPN01_09580 [Sphingomonas sp. A2-49]|uniref:hypothetical protein n=1 Tax=Sphingomonas sp. A2-49 TaxID=1391375 RepID=UPI0021D26FA4|nr:hypothetical protein [Sphingomonas sp. A2-49]MCU6454329.1 hypothetical protein [Sphingomonas sp. A2-49]